jgi:hypothetical protein
MVWQTALVIFYLAKLNGLAVGVSSSWDWTEIWNHNT